IDDPGGACREISIRFPKEMAYRVYDEFDQTQIQRQDDGDLIVSARMPEDPWLIGSLLSFGTQVDVLSPLDLKESLAEQARLIYEKNKI
ncbi:MAG: WYL domain-containing protein, partial [Lachnospiraceae bacterium]|nr:WYL domain-containing protein [Lachnospiraceae bacterium]